MDGANALIWVGANPDTRVMDRSKTKNFANDLDVFTAYQSTIVFSTQTNDIGQDPNESLTIDPTMVTSASNSMAKFLVFDLSITLVSGLAPTHMRAFAPSIYSFQFTTETTPDIFSHANATFTAGVGAVDYYNTPNYGASPPLLEPYSSIGPMPILFDINGNCYMMPISQGQLTFLPSEKIKNDLC